jgi:8-oxo-dGTP pyrophosphatase MutT (NUDIX family)
MDKAVASGAKDWGFDSLQGRHVKSSSVTTWLTRDSPKANFTGRMTIKAKREYSAGGTVFKKKGNQIVWLIIQPSAKDQPWRQGRWQLPKGWIDEGETSQQAAIREVKEEGGVEAEVIEKIDRINIFFYNEDKQRVVKNIVFFLMKYQGGREKDHGPETEKAVWLSFDPAWERLTFKSERKILEKARKILEKKEKQSKLV